MAGYKSAEEYLPVARNKGKRKFDGKWFMFLFLSVLIVLSMILAYFPTLFR
jgi:hypothetical protein